MAGRSNVPEDQRRIEDAGYMDEDGRIWLVGRVKWRVVGNGRSYWSTVVEQKVGWVGMEVRCTHSSTLGIQ